MSFKASDLSTYSLTPKGLAERNNWNAHALVGPGPLVSSQFQPGIVRAQIEKPNHCLLRDGHLCKEAGQELVHNILASQVLSALLVG